MKKILISISIAFLVSCGNKQADNSTASSNLQTIKETTESNSESSASKSENLEAKEERNCDASRLIVTWDDPDQSGTNIRNSPGGKVIATISQSEYPDGCAFEIVEQSNGWFRIQGGIQSPGNDSDIALPGGGGWIHSSVISVGTRNYGSQTIEILDSPENGKSVGRITKESYGLRVLDLCGSWVKISFNGMTGWISNQWICGIPWTTCS